jgi:hypothetical protein
VQPPSGGRPFVFVLTRAALGRRTSRRIRAPPRRMPRLLAQLRWLAFGDSWFNAKRSKYPPTSRWGESPRTATRSPGSRRRAAHPSARRSHPHTRRCAAGRDRRLRSVAPGTQPQPPHKLHTPQPAPGCVAHTHTHRGGGATRGGRAAPGTATRPHGTQFLRSGRTGGVPARPRPPTAHNCMAHPVPHTTRQRHPRRPAPRGLHNWAFAPGHRCPRTDQPRSSGYASHGSSAARAPKPAPAAAHHTACARRSPLGRPSLCPRTDFAAPGAATPAPKASCAMHCTPLAQDLQRLTTPAPPLPARCTLPQHSTRAYGCD